MKGLIKCSMVLCGEVFLLAVFRNLHLNIIILNAKDETPDVWKLRFDRIYLNSPNGLLKV